MKTRELILNQEDLKDLSEEEVIAIIGGNTSEGTWVKVLGEWVWINS